MSNPDKYVKSGQSGPNLDNPAQIRTSGSPKNIFGTTSKVPSIRTISLSQSKLKKSCVSKITILFSVPSLSNKKFLVSIVINSFGKINSAHESGCQRKCFLLT